MRSALCRITLTIAAVISAALPAAAQQRLTIVHTNDLHSHLLGAAPNIDYSPGVIDDDQTLGGFARLATVIGRIRREREQPVIVLDAGDFMMGSLFHMLSRERAFELRLMHRMGYDAVTLGNHEFDLKPRGLARILASARRYDGLPPIVAANLIFDPGDKDDDLESAFAAGLILPYRILERAGLRIGIFGLMGKDAAEVAPFASPVRFADPIDSARTMVKKLREEEKADMVICLSHSGLNPVPDRSEDELLAREVAGIDVIVSGHTHTRLDRALVVGNTVIVQAWEHGKQAGVLDLVRQADKFAPAGYQAIAIDDRIPGDPQISQAIAAFEAEINREVLAPKGVGFEQTIAGTDFDLTITTSESNLGNLIADAIRWDVNRHLAAMPDGGGVSVGVISNGVIRDPIVKGPTGAVAVCDVFRAVPLGIGFDEAETMGYPLIAVHVYPSELKKALEILTSIYPLKGSDYYLQLSGVRFSYNPRRMIFDRVTEIWLGDEETGYRRLDYSAGNKSLIGIAADIYNATFLKVIGNFTWHILDIVPKDRNGQPIRDLNAARVDADPARPGVQELKEWQAVIAYIRQLRDADADGLPDVPDRYRGVLQRQIVAASLNPVALLKRGSWLTWTVCSVLLLGIAFVAGTMVIAWRKWRR